MADVKQLLSTGDLDGAVALAKEGVRDKPAELAPRVLLFQLFSVIGDWERAMTQLNVCADLDPLALPMAQTYRQGLNAEVFRAEVFAGKRDPLVLGEPPEWLGLHIESLKQFCNGRPDAGRDLRDRALELAPATPGSVNETPFEWIADADQRLGPVLECVVNGKYYWVPFERIKSVHLEAPADLRDMVWTAAQFTWINDGQAVGLIPTRYPGSAASDDPLVRLARKTDWVEDAAGEVHGMGQRLLATDTDDVPLLDVRELSVQPQDAPSP